MLAPDWFVTTLVLLAALLHASWNAVAKASDDPLLTVSCMTVSGGVAAAAATTVVDFPHRDAWPYLALSVILHVGYQLCLVHAYRLGDLSQVYPIARGIAPCVVAALAAGFANERLAAVQVVGLFLASASLGSLGFAGPAQLRDAWHAVAAAVATGIMIGFYSFVDAEGARHSRNPFDFILWSMALDAPPMMVIALLVRRHQMSDFVRRGAGGAVIGGLMASLAYGIVVWAMSLGAMAKVAALRETSVVFAAIIGIRILGEPLGARRIGAAIGVGLGVALLQS